MKRVLKRIAIGLAAFLVLATAGLAIAVVVRQNRHFDAPYPEIHASQDPAVIARGRYLALGPAHCVACHAERENPSGEDEPAFVGGQKWDLPIGTVYARNLTPDPETGIGRYTDPEIARVLRFGVHPTGRAVMPFMPYASLSDEDLTAVISYLRSRPPVHHLVPESDFNVLGRIAKAFLLEPKGPIGPVSARVAPEPTAAYGEYLANTVANCAGCHTRRSMRTGEAIGPAFAGGAEMESHAAPGQHFTPPNLTPDPRSGHIYAWSEDVFVQRFHNAVATASPMPWGQFRHMSENDLRALYRYLRSLPPVDTSQR